MNLEPPQTRPDGTDAVAPQAGPQTGGPAVLTDGAALEHLLSLAGDEAARLMRQLCADLDGVDADLRRSFSGADKAALRAASHVLIALAGTVGAAGLCDAARALNGAAHRGDWARIRQALPAVLADLSLLRETLAARMPT